MTLKIYEGNDPSNIRFSAVDATIDELITEVGSSFVILEVFDNKIKDALRQAYRKYGIEKEPDAEGRNE